MKKWTGDTTNMILNYFYKATILTENGNSTDWKGVLCACLRNGPDGRVNLIPVQLYAGHCIWTCSNPWIRTGRSVEAEPFLVLSRMYARLTFWPVWNETIIVRTWPTESKALAMRNMSSCTKTEKDRISFIIMADHRQDHKADTETDEFLQNTTVKISM